MYYVKEMVFVSRCRKSVIKLCIYGFIFGISLLTFWIPQLIGIRSHTFFDNRLNRFPTDLKYVLMWKPSQALRKSFPFNGHSKLPEGQKLFVKQKCQFINCYITYNKALLREKHQNLDAVLINVRDIVKYPPEEFDLSRSPDQKYIFHSLDSSEKYPVCNAFYDNFFNWTWTYKLNSDVPQPLVNIHSTDGAVVGPTKNISWVTKMAHTFRFKSNTFNKTIAMAWIVPRCKTKVKYQDFIRELIDELKGYNQTLDLYGPCGNKKCPSGPLRKCYKLIEKKYFFQLVLEDSFAEDYVTERMVPTLSHTVIPVILGISDYRSFLPPGSYINAQSFDMKKIGAIIDYLIRYPMTYYYFFDWKNHYYYTARSKSEICSLCAKLNSNYTANTPTVYKNFRKWWNSDYRDACQQLIMNNIFHSD